MKLSIRTRLILAFATLLGLLLAVAGVALHRIDGLTSTTHRLIDDQVRRVSLSHQANQHAQGAALVLLKLLQTPERDDRVALYGRMDSELLAADQAVANIGQTMLNAPDQAGLDQLLTLRQRYGEAFQQTVELIESDGLLTARQHFEQQTQTALISLIDATRSLAAGQQQAMQTEVEGLQADAHRAENLVVALTMAALALGSLLAWVIGHGIARPVREAVAVAEAIADGDYAQPVPVGQADEIGALLRALATMRDSIAVRETRILRLAYVDTLTGLANRTRFQETFDALPAGARGALALLDVDRFALINNALGHEVGDRLLCEIARRLQQTLGDRVVLARLWGDEFALWFPGADRAECQQILGGVLERLRVPMDMDGQCLDIDASIGVALLPEDGRYLSPLLRRADAAVTVAKNRQDSIAFGGDLEAAPAHEQLSLIGEMRNALAHGNFVIHYQPKLDLARNCIAGAEALIRWQHPERGMVPPGRFIPFAEQTGFIREITPWVLRQVIADMAQWQQRGINIVTSVNLSTRDLLDHALVDAVLGCLAQSALPPGQLCLEITESALMDEPELALRHLHELASHGLKLSIDDYGTGQASLAYVKTLPVHELKIDRAFVSEVDHLPKNAAIVRSTILLCRELGLSVVAEGAETAAERDWLRHNQCDLLQGYIVAKPMPRSDFEAWVLAGGQAENT